MLIPSKRVDSVGGMKLAISTLCCPAWELGKIVDAAAENGITGIDFRGIGAEIDITALPQFAADLESTLKLLGDQGISLPCFNTSVTLLSPSPQRWDAMLDEARRYAMLAERTGTPYLRIFGGRSPKELTQEQAVMMAQRHLRQLVKICKPHGCLPLLETHDDWTTSPRVLELIHEFEPAEVGVIWDLEHPWRAGEAPMDTALGLRRFLRHIHVKDTIYPEEKARSVLLGQGLVPLAECAAALGRIGYDGWYCLETEKRWHPAAPEPEQSIPQFARFMRENWNQGGNRAHFGEPANPQNV
jgi:sugar phosphate isomerase/epimerase